MPEDKQRREVLVLRGRLDRAGTFTPGRMRSTPVKQWPVVGESDVVAEMLGDDGRVLHREPAELTGDLDCRPGDPQTSRVLAYLGLRSEAVVVRLVRGDLVLWEAKIPEAPTCTLTTGRIATRKRTVSLGLELSEPGEGAHVTVVHQWGEGRFEIVHIGPPETRLDLDLAERPGGRCRFLLDYSNGLRSAQSVGEFFELPLLGPQLTVVRPEPGQTLTARTPVVLEGSVLDRERRGGARPDTDLRWFVDGEPVATGPIGSVDGLVEGGHVVELRYVPDDRQEAQASTSLDVRSVASSEPTADDWAEWDPLV